MNAELVVKLVDIFKDKAWVVKALVKIYESGDQDAINSLESTLSFHAKKAASGKEGSNG